jgi:hypothetical protein
MSASKLQTAADLAEYDLTKYGFPIGVFVDGNRNWIELDEDDWKILHRLLTTPLGRENTRAHEASATLSLLNEIAIAAINHFNKWPRK